MTSIAIWPEQLQKELQFWQTVLRLRDWSIRAELSESLDPGVMGECECHAEKRWAVIRLRPFSNGLGELESCTFGEEYNMQETLVHELLHCVFAAISPEENALAIEQGINVLAPLLASARYWLDAQVNPIDISTVKGDGDGI